MTDTAHQFSKMTLALHWLIALIMISMLALGLYMEGMEDGADKWALYGWHKAAGVYGLVFILWRFVRRLKLGMPPHVANADYQSWEKTLSHITHWVLLLGTLVMPLSGVCMSFFGGHNIDLFIFVIPGLEPKNEIIGGAAHSVHELAGNALVVAIALHAVGAIKHHVLDKDGTFQRMLGKHITR